MGAVYRPVEDMLPTIGFRLQVTLWSAVLATVAVNCWVCPALSAGGEVGVTVTEMGAVVAAVPSLTESLPPASVSVLASVSVSVTSPFAQLMTPPVARKRSEKPSVVEPRARPSLAAGESSAPVR